MKDRSTISRAAAGILTVLATTLTLACSGGGPTDPPPPPPPEPRLDKNTADLGLPSRLTEGERISCNVGEPDILNKGNHAVWLFVQFNDESLIRVICEREAGVGTPAFLALFTVKEWVRAKITQVKVIYMLGSSLGNSATEPPDPILDEFSVVIPVDPAK